MMNATNKRNTRRSRKTWKASGASVLGRHSYVAALEIQSTLMDRIREAQKTDKEIATIKEKMNIGKAKGFREDEHDTLWFEDRVFAPIDPEIRKLILQEAHDSPYSIHPGNTKMYLDLKDTFWWT